MHQNSSIIRMKYIDYLSIDELDKVIDPNVYYLYDIEKMYFHNTEMHVPANYSGDIYNYVSLLQSEKPSSNDAFLSLVNNVNKKISNDKPIEKYKIKLWAYTEGIGLKDNGDIVDLHRTENEAMMDGLMYH